MRNSTLVSYLADNAEAIHRFVSDSAIDDDARRILERLTHPEASQTRVELWANVDPLERPELAPLGSYYLGVLQSCLKDHRISPDERFVLKQLRLLLWLDDGLLLRQHATAVELLVLSEMADILADDLLDAQEQLHEVALQEALGLSYDEYVVLVSRAHDRLKTEIETGSRKIAPADYNRRMAALESMIRTPPRHP